MPNTYIVDINEKLLSKTILIFSINTVKCNLAVNGGDYNSEYKVVYLLFEVSQLQSDSPNLLLQSWPLYMNQYKIVSGH